MVGNQLKCVASQPRIAVLFLQISHVSKRLCVNDERSAEFQYPNCSHFFGTVIKKFRLEAIS
jgi:hypothetical protein